MSSSGTYPFAASSYGPLAQPPPFVWLFPDDSTYLAKAAGGTAKETKEEAHKKPPLAQHGIKREPRRQGRRRSR